MAGLSSGRYSRLRNGGAVRTGRKLRYWWSAGMNWGKFRLQSHDAAARYASGQAVLAVSRLLRPYSNRNAFTGSRRAARYAGMKAATEQITKALRQIMMTSRGTISAGISENW